MKMFSTQNDGEQITKLNSRVTDLHDAYRVLLQNVNRLQKELDEKCSFKVHLKLSDQVDFVENEQQRLEEKIIDINTKVVDDYKELDWRLEKIEDKVLDQKNLETIHSNTIADPIAEYKKAKRKFAEAKMDVLLHEVRFMEWSRRAANCLRNADIETVKDLCSYTEKTLLKRNNLGKRTLKEIKDVLDSLDLKLRDEND